MDGLAQSDEDACRAIESRLTDILDAVHVQRLTPAGTAGLRVMVDDAGDWKIAHEHLSVLPEPE